VPNQSNDSILKWQDAIANALDSNQWQLIILPTEQCNFRCSYCYEKFRLRTMSRDTITALKRLVQRRFDEGIGGIRIQWFGGEPLLARSIIRDFTIWLLSVKPRSVNYSASITTNAYLLDLNCLKELCTLGISAYQISLDGWADEHDKTRVRRDGKGTFLRIWGNLLSAHESDLDFKITLRLHFSAVNLQSVKQLISRINQSFGDDPRFRVFLKPISRLGSKNDAELPVLYSDRERQIHKQLEAMLQMTSSHLTLDMNSPYMCYASMPNSLMIRSDGQIGKCTVALDDPVNNVGHLNSDGTLAFVQERLAPWFSGLYTIDTRTLSCPLSQLKNSERPPAR
jgi:uncharacterized protein